MVVWGSLKKHSFYITSKQKRKNVKTKLQKFIADLSEVLDKISGENEKKLKPELTVVIYTLRKFLNSLYTKNNENQQNLKSDDDNNISLNSQSSSLTETETTSSSIDSEIEVKKEGIVDFLENARVGNILPISCGHNGAFFHYPEIEDFKFYLRNANFVE